jgi:NAD+ synthase (glutamine-hydrolysing)
MTFHSIYRQGFARVAASVTVSHVADPAANAIAIVDAAKACDKQSAALAVFPELCLSGYAIEDLIMQDPLLDAVVQGLVSVVAASAGLMTVLIIGAPLRHSARVYNCAVVVHRGRILGVAPKAYLPTYREFCEGRHFASGAGITGSEIAIGQMKVPFGTDLLFEANDVSGLTIGVEICEDMWTVTPGSKLALAGATVLVNLSGSPVTIGRALSRELLSRSCSARCIATYVYAAAGAGESTTDLSWDGQTSIFENGVLLAEGKRFLQEGQITFADIDLDLLRQERSLMGTFDDNRRHEQRGEAVGYRKIGYALEPPPTDIGFLRTIERFPFVPSDQSRLDQRDSCSDFR